MKEWKRFTAFLLSLLIIVTSVDVSSLVSSASNSTVTSPNATITSPNTPEGEPEDPENLEGLGDLEDLGDSEETTYTYCVTDLSATAQMELKWLTNLLPETVPAIPFTLYYQIDSGEKLLFATVYADGGLEIAEGVQEAFGLTKDQLAGIKLEKVTVGTGMDAYTVSGLPAAREVLSGENTEKTEKITYFWGGEDETLNQGYIIQKTDAGYSLIPVIKFTAKVGANVGYRNEYKPTESDVVESFKLQRVTGSGVIDCKFNENHTISVGNDADPYARWKLENGELVIEDLQEYSDQKELIDWQVSVDTNSYNKNITDGSGDYFSAGYNNSKVPNYGSDRSTCHNGGTMYINLRGWTSFSANKIWLDEYTEANNDTKKAHRPVTDWALWRYSGKEGVDWNTSSPVRDDESSVITWSVDVTKNSSSYTSVGYQNLSEGLPKYDSDGYPYVYFVRENMSGGDSYEQVFGVIGVDENGNPTIVEEERADKKDRALYNGGTLLNRRTESKITTVKKTWDSAVYQDQLKDVYVELTLQTKASESADWEYTDIKTYLTGFSAERLTREKTIAIPAYDEFGKPHIFRWAETGVYEGNPETDKDLPNLFDAAKGKTTLGENALANLQQGDYEYYVATDDGDTIVNKLYGETSYLIKKNWVGGLTPKEKENAYITWTLLRDGEVFEYENVRMDKNTGWERAITGLPKYNQETGAEYEYIVIETECGLKGWSAAQPEYNEQMTVYEGSEDAITRQKNTVQLINRRTGGEVVEIQVRKQWIDDNDNGCRQPVVVDVVRNAYEDNPETTVAENVSLKYQNNWWSKIDVTEYLLENGKIGNYDQWAEENPGKTPTSADLLTDATYSLIEKLPDGKGGYIRAFEDIGLKTPSEKGCYIGTDNHVYYIEYVDNGKRISELTDGYYDVINRRVGVINIAVEKTWIDGHGSSAIQGGVEATTRTGYEAKLVLSCDGEEATISGNRVALHGENSPAGTAMDILTASGNKVSCEQNIGINLDKDGKEIVYFYNLPKYDKDGKVIKYKVEEIAKNASSGEDENILEEKDYTVTITETYEAGNRHTNDRQEIKITNKRQDTKNVTFYKEWKDESRFTSKQRPDIYLTLYALSKSEGLQPTEYRNILWAEKPQMSRVVPDKVEMEFGNYNWSCTFTGLPEYNQYGETIYYFATENMHVNRDNLEYLDTQYKWDGTYMGEPLSLNFSSVVYDSDEDKYEVQTDTTDTDGVTRHYYIIDPSDPDNKISGVNEILLREGGTFVNQLQNTISIEGTKIWENIPGSFAVDDLPHLDIQVWRAPETLVEKNEEKYYTENGLPKTENWDKAAWINDFVSTNLSTLFTIKYEGENTVSGNTVSGNAVRLKQYDDNGSRYVYVVTEDVKSPGAEVDGSIAGSYSSNPAVKGYQITNVYNPDDNKGVLDVKKTWGAFPDAWDNEGVLDKIEYPELTFTLYWRYKKNNQEGETGTKYSELTKVDMEGVVSEKTLVYDENNHTVVFENLPIKAPNGSAYEYYVVEQKVGGYIQNTTSSPNVESEVVKELKDKLGRDDITVSQLPAPRSAKSQEGIVATTFGGIINRIKDVLGVEREDSKVSTVFTNTYKEQETFSIKGTKIWNDYQNKLGTRPESLTLEVYRKSHEKDEQLLLTVSGNGTSSGNCVVENPDIFANTGELKVTWAEDANGHWTYTISGLDQYAENGKLWQYKVVEKTEKDGESLIGEYTAKKSETGYITAPTTYQKDKPEQLDDLIVKNLENDLYTTHTVKKQWSGINADIAKLPVIVKLQVKAGEQGIWQDAVDYFKGDKDIGYTLPWTQTMQIGSSYSYTWHNLPKGEQLNGEFVAYSYRAVETAIGEETVTFNGTGDEQSYTNTGLFKITATTNEQTTTITNTLIDDERVALKITKTWEDSDNQYNLRPVQGTDDKIWEVSFKIWREATVSGNTVTEKYVKATDGKNDLIVTISGNNILGSIENEKTITVDDLPKQTLVSLEDGMTGWAEWSYYAEEVVPENSVLDNGYAQTVSGGNLPEKMFSSTTLNTLETINIQGKKVWDDKDIEHRLRPENVTLTLYVSDNGSTWKEASAYNSGFNGVEPDWDKTTDDNTWTWSYEGLPKTNASGEELQYKVVETTVPGYWKAKDSVAKANIADTQDTAAETKSIEFTDIVNSLTEFTLDKIGDSDIDSGEITNVSLTFEGVTGTSTEGWKLVWTRENNTERYVITQDGEDKVAGTDNTGKPVVIKGLPVGAYKLTDEKVPNGYKTLEGTGYGFTLDANESIIVTNEPQELSLKKTDLAGNELNGAVFTVTGPFRTTDTGTTSDDAVREIGGTDPDKQLKKGDLVADKEYVLKETKAPTGYLVSDVEVTFKMNENGNAEIISPKTDSPATVSGNQIIFKDEPIELYLRKTKNLNAAGDEGNIDGAEFKLEEHVSGENSAEASWSVVSNKLTVFGGNLELNAATDYKLKTGTNYRLTEIKAADGYILNRTPIYFKIASDGTFKDSTVETTGNTLIQTSMSGNELKVLNDPISITLTKHDGDKHKDDALTLGYADVVFTLTDQENEQSVQTKATDTSGKLAFGAEAGAHQFAVIGGKSYTLTETVPEGYKSVPSVTVSVAEDGTITLSGNSIGKDEEQTISVSPDQKELTVKNRRIPGKVTVQKVDLYDDTGLEGAVFELLYKSVPGKESGTVAQTKTTDKDGMLVFESLEWGTYELVEKTAPEGYILDEKPIEIVITNREREHSLIMVDGTAITNCKNSLEIYKNGQNTDEKLQAGFGLYFKKDQEWEKISLSEQLADTILLSGLRVGTYKLVEEIPPTGYCIPANAADGELIFKMGEDGKVTTSETISSYYTVSNGTADQDGVYPNTITMKDDLTQAIIQKTDQDGNALTGAVFEVSGKFVSTLSGSTSSTITITDENRETALKGELIAGETYQIKEIDAPTGYKKPEDADVHFTLTVNLNGTYAVSSAAGAVLNGTTIEVPDNVTDTVWIKDEPLNITLIKRDADFQKGDKETLENVTFTLQEKGVEDAAKIQTAVTDKDGELHLGLASENSFDVYVGRTYILKEVSAPAGYIIGLPEAGVELLVNANGTVTFTEIENVISGNNTSTLTVMNERETGTLVLTKKDSHLTKDQSDDTALNGITFSLYRKQDGNWLDKFVNFITGKSYTMTDSFVWGQEETYPSGVSTEDGKIVIAGLVWGDYKIVESKADGYVLDGSEFKFSIGPDSELKQYLEVSLGEIINDPNYVVVKKVDKANNRRLAGAVFTLKDSNGKRVKDIQWSWNSDKGEGKAYRLAPGTYTLTETKVPSGYVKMSPVRFEMKADGTIELLRKSSSATLMKGDVIGLLLKNTRKEIIPEEEEKDSGESFVASPKTGDQAPVAGLFIAMGAAIAVFVTTKILKKRKEK